MWNESKKWQKVYLKTEWMHLKYVPSNKKTNFMCKNGLSFPGCVCVLCGADSHVALQGGADWLISRRRKHSSSQNLLNCNSLQSIGAYSRARARTWRVAGTRLHAPIGSKGILGFSAFEMSHCPSSKWRGLSQEWFGLELKNKLSSLLFHNNNNKLVKLSRAFFLKYVSRVFGGSGGSYVFTAC